MLKKSVQISLQLIAFSLVCRETKPPQYAAIEEWNVYGCLQGKIANPASDDTFLYAKGDFLYWVPHEDGLEYAFVQDSPMNTAGVANLNLTAPVQNGQYRRVDAKWLPGVRVEGGMRLPLDDLWSVFGRWTWLEGKMEGSSHIDSIATKNIAPIWLGAGFQVSGYERATSASGAWNLHYNLAQAAVSRNFFSSAYLLFNVQSGLQGAWINQQMRADYSGGTIVRTPTYFKGKNNFRAVGLFAAGNLSYYVRKSWKLIGGVLGSVNFGRYKLEQQVLAAIDDGVLSLPYSLHDVLKQTEHRTRFAYEAHLGIEWGARVTDWLQLAVSAQYDLTEWVDMNQLRRFTFANSQEERYFYSMNGNLGFQGVSLSIRGDY